MDGGTYSVSDPTGMGVHVAAVKIKLPNAVGDENGFEERKVILQGDQQPSRRKNHSASARPILPILLLQVCPILSFLYGLRYNKVYMQYIAILPQFCPFCLSDSAFCHAKVFCLGDNYSLPRSPFTFQIGETAAAVDVDGFAG